MRIQINSTSGILYVRAGLKPFMRHIRDAGGIQEFLVRYFNHKEIFVPYFLPARPIWKRPESLSKLTNSGTLGKLIAELPNAVFSHHPTHRFVGIGTKVGDILRMHDHTTSCFFPIRELALKHDFSMLLFGCVNESPGFSTVHAVQNELGLSQKHLIRYLLRWDIETETGIISMTAKESPGCSMSFNKFYPYYESDKNLIRGELLGQPYLYVPSARRAMTVERELLVRNPRFVDCGRATCLTCRLRLY